MVFLGMLVHSLCDGVKVVIPSPFTLNHMVAVLLLVDDSQSFVRSTPIPRTVPLAKNFLDWLFMGGLGCKI